MSNRTRIVINSKIAKSGIYRVEVERRRFWFFRYWDPIPVFFSHNGEWGYVLGFYREAREFAIRAQDPRFLDGWIEDQRELARSADRLLREVIPTGELYPVEWEVFDGNYKDSGGEQDGD